jgi:AcrR family transcriptional regulator
MRCTERSTRGGTQSPDPADLIYEDCLVIVALYEGELVKSRRPVDSMGTNQVRRTARRQERGLRRAEAILDAAEQVFAELGYDQASATAVASSAGISPGSLYQFFPSKQAIAQALGVRFAKQLRVLHEQALAPEIAPPPLAGFLDRIIDPIVAFNRDHPALIRLFGGTHVSPDLQDLLADLRSSLLERFDAGFAARLPHFDPVRRRRMVIVSLQIALALLPLTLCPDGRQGDAFAIELKAALHAYWAAPFHDRA